MTQPAGPHLQDIHPAPPPSWWPPAYGWWVLACALLVMLCLFAWWFVRRKKASRRHGRMQADLDHLAERYRHTHDNAWLAAELSQRLRRAARLHAPHAVTLQGSAWHDFLREQAPEGTDVSALCSLEQSLYRPGGELDGESALRAAHAWIRHAVAGR